MQDTDYNERERDNLLRLLVALGRKFVLARGMALAGPDDDPQPGDLVVETTLFRLDPDAIGWLVGHDDAPYHEDDPLDGSVPMREVWDIRPLSGRVQPGKNYTRWENATFAKLPDTVASTWPKENTAYEPRPAALSRGSQDVVGSRPCLWPVRFRGIARYPNRRHRAALTR